MLILVMGLPGSGKTYLANMICEETNATHINSDKTRKDMGLMGDYRIEDKKKVYGTMLQKVELALKRKECVVVDATFYKSSVRKLYDEMAIAAGASICRILVYARESVIKERVSHVRLHSEADFEVYLKLKSEFETITNACLAIPTDRKDDVWVLKTAMLYIKKCYDQSAS